MVRKRTGRVQFLALLRLWTGPPQNNNNNNTTDSALSTMVVYAESAIVQNKFALGVFLDIQEAFDNVSIDAVIKGMQDKDFPEVFINW